jgi:hypothetical protein
MLEPCQAHLYLVRPSPVAYLGPALYVTLGPSKEPSYVLPSIASLDLALSAA